MCLTLSLPAGVLSEHLITTYEVQERHPKSKTSPAPQNPDLDQKKPRRKDTPALHVSPFAGKKSWCSRFAGAAGTGRGPRHLEVPRAWPLSCPAICRSERSGEEQHLLLPFRFPLTTAPPGLMWRWGVSEYYSYFSRTGQMPHAGEIEKSAGP